MKLRKILAMTLAAVMTLSLGSMAVTAEETTEAAAEATVESPVAGKKVAYIMFMSPATIFNMWSDSFTATAEKLGMTADTFFCNDNAEEWQNRIATCAAAGYDGLMVSHGGQEYEEPDLSQNVEETVVAQALVDQFKATLSEKDMQILELRMSGDTLEEIAEKLGYKNHSGVLKRIRKIGQAYEAYTGVDYGFESGKIVE